MLTAFTVGDAPRTCRPAGAAALLTTRSHSLPTISQPYDFPGSRPVPSRRGDFACGFTRQGKFLLWLSPEYNIPTREDSGRPSTGSRHCEVTRVLSCPYNGSSA